MCELEHYNATKTASAIVINFVKRCNCILYSVGLSICFVGTSSSADFFSFDSFTLKPFVSLCQDTTTVKLQNVESVLRLITTDTSTFEYKYPKIFELSQFSLTLGCLPPLSLPVLTHLIFANKNSTNQPLFSTLLFISFVIDCDELYKYIRRWRSLWMTLSISLETEKHNGFYSFNRHWE